QSQFSPTSGFGGAPQNIDPSAHKSPPKLPLLPNPTRLLLYPKLIISLAAKLISTHETNIQRILSRYSKNSIRRANLYKPARFQTLQSQRADRRQAHEGAPSLFGHLLAYHSRPISRYVRRRDRAAPMGGRHQFYQHGGDPRSRRVRVLGKTRDAILC